MQYSKCGQSFRRGAKVVNFLFHLLTYGIELDGIVVSIVPYHNKYQHFEIIMTCVLLKFTIEILLLFKRNGEIITTSVLSS